MNAQLAFQPPELQYAPPHRIVETPGPPFANRPIIGIFLPRTLDQHRCLLASNHILCYV
jgi:hypothetical protein